MFRLIFKYGKKPIMKIGEIIKANFSFKIMMMFIVHYGFAFILLFSFYFFPNYSRDLLFSNYLSWSITLLIPNIYLFVIYIKLSQESSNFLYGSSLLLAFGLFTAYLLFNTSPKFVQYIETKLLLLSIIFGFINLIFCYLLATPIFAKDIKAESYKDALHERPEEIKEDFKEIRNILEQEVTS